MANNQTICPSQMLNGGALQPTKLCSFGGVNVGKIYQSHCLWGDFFLGEDVNLHDSAAENLHHVYPTFMSTFVSRSTPRWERRTALLQCKWPSKQASVAVCWGLTPGKNDVTKKAN